MAEIVTAVEKMGIQLNQKERSKTFYGVAQAMAEQ